MDADAVLARHLQQQFDEEQRRLQEQEDTDLAMAAALSMGHAISDSEDSDSGDSPSLLQHKAQKKSKKTNTKILTSQQRLSDSDSEHTDNKEDMVVSRKQAGSVNSSSSKKKKASQEHDLSRPSTSKTASADLSKRKADSGSNEKPMCKFGSGCYRRNERHLKEFRHPDDNEGTPLSKKRKTDGNQRLSPSKATRNCAEVIEEASPLCFLLTKVSGISSQYNSCKAVHISDILSECMGDLVESAQFNYMHDIPWLIEQYPKNNRSKPLLLVHGEQREGKMTLHETASAYPNIKLCQAKLEMMWGTHHSKMMLLLYTNGMRVVIHTANLIHQDWHQKTQGVWISPLFPKLSGSPGGTGIAGDSPTHFKSELIEYLAAYKARSLLDWIAHIKKHDMSSAKVHIISSVPGRHIGEAMNRWGHMKMRKVLKKHGPVNSDVKDWPVIGQFSSVGSLGPDKSKWLCAEWLQSMSATQGESTSFVRDDNRMLKLIFPSKDNIRTSLEGYPAGASVPYSIQTAKKQLYFNTFLHQWKSTKRGRSRASPHIKTYSRLSPGNDRIPWFIVTSANMSKAAWGALEKNASQLMIRSYEIGVLFLPHYFNSDSKFFAVGDAAATSKMEPLHFPLPWDVPLVPYTKEVLRDVRNANMGWVSSVSVLTDVMQILDRPWIWNIPYQDKPDSHGNVWCPPTR